MANFTDHMSKIYDYAFSGYKRNAGHAIATEKNAAPIVERFAQETHK